MSKPSATLVCLARPCNKKFVPWLPSLPPSDMIWPKLKCEWLRSIGEHTWQKTLVSESVLRNLRSFVFPTLNWQLIWETDNWIFLKEDGRNWKPTSLWPQKAQQYPASFQKFWYCGFSRKMFICDVCVSEQNGSWNMASDVLCTLDSRYEGGGHWDWAVSIVIADTTKKNYRKDAALMDMHHPQTPEQRGVCPQTSLHVEWDMDFSYYITF